MMRLSSSTRLITKSMGKNIMILTIIVRELIELMVGIISSADQYYLMLPPPASKLSGKTKDGSFSLKKANVVFAVPLPKDAVS